ncbi:hypothetical protein [Aureimonas psammosilenae]|uniref:hypothetical protein n=1 Tax=Aureimonas psammosilenae TaxID=2495496 RepID=UPI001260B068|nr:hypothetical protein [Aureimonas psammosilenae]
MSATVHHAAVAAPAVVAPRRVSWGAIIAGALLTLVVQIMLGLLGIGIGLATVDPAGNGTPTAATLGTSAGIWTGATVLIATFVGGYVAARLSGSLTKGDGALHGIVTWAASTLLIVYLLTSGAGSVINGTLGTLGSSFGAIKNTVQAATPNSLSVLPDGLESDVRQLLARGEQQAQQGADQVQAQGQQAADQARSATGEQDLTRAIPEIVRGLGQNATPEQRQAAVTVISQQAGISQGEAEQRLQQFQTRYNQAMAELREQADAAAAGASTAALTGFAALLAGLIVAGIGGAAGRPKRLEAVAAV